MPGTERKPASRKGGGDAPPRFLPADVPRRTPDAPRGVAAPSYALELYEVTKSYGEVTAVSEFDLQVRPGEFLTLLGPSGCGKTTALRIIGGLEQPDSGRVRFDGMEITRIPAERRGFGFVFQNYALFPHLDVKENVAYGLRARKMADGLVHRRVTEALARVDLAGYGRRRVQELSGGQQQRVALARALAIQPPLLLLDEPLSNLDAALRERTRTEIRSLVKELGITAIFVTHDQEEAFALADRIAVMRSGWLRQIGSPVELYRAPSDLFVATFLGKANVLRGTVRRAERGKKQRLELRAGAAWPIEPDPARRFTHGEELVAVVRPEEMLFTSDAGEDTLDGEVLSRRFQGATTVYRIGCQDGSTAELVGKSEGPGPGDTAHLRIGPQASLHLFRPAEGEEEG